MPPQPSRRCRTRFTGKSPPRPEVDAEQRLADVFELTNSVFARMHEGAMWQMGVTDAEEGWKIVRQRLKRLQRAQHMGRFTDRKSEAAHDR